ncbi:MAG: hypothetical protein ACPGXK_05205 [Phycisphaerae bacterium]
MILKTFDRTRARFAGMMPIHSLILTCMVVTTVTPVRADTQARPDTTKSKATQPDAAKSDKAKRAKPRIGVTQDDDRRKTDLASLVPVDTGLFVTINQPEELDFAMARARGWQLLALLAGRDPAKMPEFTLRRALEEFIGDESSLRLDGIMNSELGMMAENWNDLRDSAWLVRPESEAVLRRWFPGLGESGSNLVHTESGLVVTARRDCALLNRSGGNTFGRAVVLLAGRKLPTLYDDPRYQELSSFLPGRPLATAYLHQPSREKQELIPGLPTSMSRAVIGLYEGRGKIDVSIRGALDDLQVATELNNECVQRLFQLPDTTMLASAFTPGEQLTGVATSGMAATSNGRLDEVQRIITMLRSMQGGQDAIDPFENLGPHVILAWDIDMRPGKNSPQLAVMTPCGDPEKTMRGMDELARNLQQLVNLAENVPVASLPRIRRAKHLGIGVNSLTLSRYAEVSALPFVQLLKDVEPTWTVHEDWFVFGLSRDHVERMIDARHGLIATCGAEGDAAELASRKRKLSSLAILQPDLAANVINDWLTDWKNGKPSFLDQKYWERRDVDRRPARLGIGMVTEQIPGVVQVARVYPGTIADGYILPGDRIVGLDGVLLSLKAPNADLRGRWLQSDQTRDTRTFRVDRGGEVIEVELSVRRWNNMQASAFDPALMLQEFSAMASKIQFSSFSTFVTEPNRFAAQASLRLRSTE